MLVILLLIPLTFTATIVSCLFFLILGLFVGLVLLSWFSFLPGIILISMGPNVTFFLSGGLSGVVLGFPVPVFIFSVPLVLVGVLALVFFILALVFVVIYWVFFRLTSWSWSMMLSSLSRFRGLLLLVWCLWWALSSVLYGVLFLWWVSVVWAVASVSAGFLVVSVFSPLWCVSPWWCSGSFAFMSWGCSGLLSVIPSLWGSISSAFWCSLLSSILSSLCVVLRCVVASSFWCSGVVSMVVFFLVSPFWCSLSSSFRCCFRGRGVVWGVLFFLLVSFRSSGRDVYWVICVEVLALVSSVTHSHLEESAGGVVSEVVGVGLVCSFLGVSLGFLFDDVVDF